jgi:hypothetical protein
MKNTYYILNKTEVLKLTESAYIALHEFDKEHAVHIVVEYNDGFILSVFNQGELRKARIDCSTDIRFALWAQLGAIGFDSVTNAQNKEMAERVNAGENLHVFIAQEKKTA